MKPESISDIVPAAGIPRCGPTSMGGGISFTSSTCGRPSAVCCARKYLQQVAEAGSLILFVGTKRQAAETIEQQGKRCGMPYVNDRWLGGTLTNFRTIRSRLTRLEELEALRSSEELGTYSKKMQSALTREYRKMFRNLNGMRTMNRVPECLVIIDPKKEKNAVREAHKLGVTTLALIDSDSDPDEVELANPRQRRQHPLDRARRAALGRRRVGGQSCGGGIEAGRV